MKIGIISEGYGDKSIGLLADCDKIIVLKKNEINADGLRRVVFDHMTDELVIPSIVSIGLQLIQLLPSFKLLNSENKIIHFIIKDTSNSLSDETYFKELFHLSLAEEKTIKQRTRTSIRKAKANGVVVGRPKIDNTLINKIRHLYSEKKTIREIAQTCNVSVGTAFKYAKQ